MTTARLIRIGIALVITAAAVWFSRQRSARTAESAAPSLDTRTALALPAEADLAVRREMRGMLAAMGNAMAGALAGDVAAVAEAARSSGTAAAVDPELEALLPPGWKELAERAHGSFDALAAAAARTTDRQALRDTVLVNLGSVTGTCTACHEQYRLGR
jgi:cytochrome c556